MRLDELEKWISSFEHSFECAIIDRDIKGAAKVASILTALKEIRREADREQA